MFLKEYNDFDQINDLNDIWNNEIKKSHNNTIFTTWEWISCWIKYFGKNKKIKLLLAKNNKEILGIAPLMISEYKFLKVGKINILEFVGTPHSDYNNFILIKKEESCINLFLNYIFKNFHEWDYINLSDINEKTLTTKLIDKIKTNKNIEIKKSYSNVCPFILLPSTFESYLNILSKNMKKNLRKRYNKLKKKYEIKVITQDNYYNIEEAMNTFIELHQKRWKDKKEKGAFVDKIFKSFHLSVAKLFHNKGWLSMLFLLVNDIPVSSIYSFDYNNKKYGYLTGYDPNYSKYGVGNIIKLYAIKNCIKKRLKEYDLMRGNEPYKYDWTNKIRFNVKYSMANNDIFPKMYDYIIKNKFCLTLYRTLNDRARELILR